MGYGGQYTCLYRCLMKGHPWISPKEGLTFQIVFTLSKKACPCFRIKSPPFFLAELTNFIGWTTACNWASSLWSSSTYRIAGNFRWSRIFVKIPFPLQKNFLRFFSLIPFKYHCFSGNQHANFHPHDINFPLFVGVFYVSSGPFWTLFSRLISCQLVPFLIYRKDMLVSQARPFLFLRQHQSHLGEGKHCGRERVWLVKQILQISAAPHKIT